MAMSERRRLVWDIKKSLFTLSAEELLHIANNVGSVPSPDRREFEEEDQDSCFDYISTFMNSKHLLESEDGGMAELLVLKDCIDTVVKNRNMTSAGDNVSTQSIQPVNVAGKDDICDLIQTGGRVYDVGPVDPVLQSWSNETTRPGPARTASGNKTLELQGMLNSYEELGRMLRQNITNQQTEPSSPPPTQPDSEHRHTHQQRSVHQLTAQPTREEIISLRELSYLQRREFKVQGGQVGDHSSDISYNNICKQMKEGQKDGFPDAEIIRGVLRIVKPGTFKDMLINKDDLTVMELKGFLQAHLREKNSTELFQELMCARQEESESPQQFLYRVIGLKQQVMFTSKLSDSGINYTPATVQDVFLHTVYQGLAYKHSDIRRELKPLLSSSDVSDETILRHLTRITSEESERHKRMGPARRHATGAHSAQLELNIVQECNKEGSHSPKTKPDPIKELTAKIEELTNLVETMRQQSQLHGPESVVPPVQNRRRDRKKSYGCPSCVEGNRSDCSHCFFCGEDGHRAVGCLRKQQNQGNIDQSLQRGTQ
ncbi:uncharacterized protein [Nothobranchius furzeri]|uniref:uncharacterized protein n=1 Tax=Nothobranchius furzeri TaxID=105023 RepID=UPI0039047216